MMHEKQNQEDESVSFRASLLYLPERMFYVAAQLLVQMKRKKRKNLESGRRERLRQWVS